MQRSGDRLHAPPRPKDAGASSITADRDRTMRRRVTERWRTAVMPKRGPWYSTRPVATKHHDNSLCIEGNNIEDRNLARGTGKLPLCRRCAELNAAGK